MSGLDRGHSPSNFLPFLNLMIRVNAESQIQESVLTAFSARVPPRISSHLMRFSAMLQEVAEIYLKALYFFSFISLRATMGIVLAGIIRK
jgi:hypothetical protein